MPLNWNPMNSNLPPDTKWWLQLQPSFVYQKDFTCHQQNALDDELEETIVETAISSSKQLEEPLLGGPMDIDSEKNDCTSKSPWMVSTAFMKHDSERIGKVKTVRSNSQQPLNHKVDMGDYFFQKEELVGWKSIDVRFPRKPEKACSDLETPWAGGNKCEPWWHIADKNELASLVAHKSQQHIENCDLPRPTQMSKDTFACLESVHSNRIFSSSVDQKLHAGICNSVDYSTHCCTSGSIDGKHRSSGELGRSLCDTEKLCRSGPASESDASRDELLEALRRSQNRAREAETAAKRAYDEKEHIVNLLFRQASHLFACKQWLQMLQLESLCLKLRTKDHRLRMLFPVLPWMPLKGKQVRKGKEQRECNVLCEYAVVFAVGLGLAGAGLLLGWSQSWDGCYPLSRLLHRSKLYT